MKKKKDNRIIRSKTGIPALICDCGDVKIEDIIIDPDLQPREILWDDQHSEKAMMTSIEKDGMQHPPVVELIGEGFGAKFLLINGHRRYEAVKAMGKEKTIYCTIKNTMTKDERLAIVIRNDINQKEFTSEEKDKIWNQHYKMRHKKECGCRHSGKTNQKCKYSIRKWSNEMGISVKTASKHVTIAYLSERQAGSSSDTKDPKKLVKKKPEFVSIPKVKREVKEKIVEESKIQDKTVGEVIEDRFSRKKCPHCGKFID